MPDFISLVLGDYFVIEERDGMLDAPHPYDPNRLTGHRIGYGWPDSEWEIILLARVLGARSWGRNTRREEPQCPGRTVHDNGCLLPAGHSGTHTRSTNGRLSHRAVR